MATVGEAIAATIDAQWSGLGGTKPDPIVYLVEHPEMNPNPKAADAVFVWLPLRRLYDNDIDVAEKYRNVTYTIRIECHTKTDSARQLEIENEVDRILASGAVITGATKQKVLEINDVSNRSYSVGAKFVSEILMEVFTAMEVSATAYGAATATTVVTDTLTVNTWLKTPLIKHTNGNDAITLSDGGGGGVDADFSGTVTIAAARKLIFTAGGGTGDIDIVRDEDDMASDDDSGLATQQSIKAYIDKANMIGDANAAWVPMMYAHSSDPSLGKLIDGRIISTGAASYKETWMLPLPCNKGGLKLYLKALKYAVQDADAQAFIDSVRISGINGNTRADLDTDDTDHTSVGDKTFSGASFPASVLDTSTYQSILIQMSVTSDAANELDIHNIRMQCYYDT